MYIHMSFKMNVNETLRFLYSSLRSSRTFVRKSASLFKADQTWYLCVFIMPEGSTLANQDERTTSIYLCVHVCRPNELVPLLQDVLPYQDARLVVSNWWICVMRVKSRPPSSRLSVRALKLQTKDLLIC